MIDKSDSNNNHLPRLLSIGVSLLYFVAGGFLPALIVENEGGYVAQCLVGWQTFVLGPIELLFGNIGWSANPALWIAVYLFLKKEYSFSVGFSCLALFLGFSTSLLFSSGVPMGDSAWPLKAMGLGYYLWMISIAIIFISANLLNFQSMQIQSANRQQVFLKFFYLAHYLAIAGLTITLVLYHFRYSLLFKPDCRF